MKITAAVVPVRSAPFEIETLDLAAPAEEVLVRVAARGMYHTDLHAFTRAFAGMTTPKLCPEIGGQAFSGCQLAGTACQPVLHWVTYG
jgi:Zn-dependent alcohol dehydrogenase